MTPYLHGNGIPCKTCAGTGRFTLKVYDQARAMDDAFDEAVMKAKTETDLPVFEGTPEA